MKYMLALGCLMLAVPSPAFAHADPRSDEAANPEVQSTSFDECTEFQDDFQSEYGKPEVILDWPQLRILKFTSNGEHEQVACDAEEHTMMLLYSADGD